MHATEARLLAPSCVIHRADSRNSSKTGCELLSERTEASVVLRCRQSTPDLDSVKGRVGPNEGRIQASRGRSGCSALPRSASGVRRSRGGWTDGHDEKQRHRPNPWWLNGRPWSAGTLLAEVVVVERTAVAGSSGTGRSRGNHADGRYGQHRPKPWRSHRRPPRTAIAQAEAVVVGRTAVSGSSVTGGTRCGRH